MCCWICDHLKPSSCREEPAIQPRKFLTALRWIEIVVGRPGEIAEMGEAKNNCGWFHQKMMISIIYGECMVNVWLIH